MAEIVELLADVVGAGNVLSGDAVSPDYAHDEALTATPSLPLAVVRPGCTAEVSDVLRIAGELHVPVTAQRQWHRALGRGDLTPRTGSSSRSSG